MTYHGGAEPGTEIHRLRDRRGGGQQGGCAPRPINNRRGRTRMTASTMVKIDRIRIGDRIRSDLGVLESLAASIRKVGGLIQPVAVTPKMELIAGLRRIRAAALAGLTEVPVHVIASAADAATLLRAETDENTERKAFTPSEMVKAAQRLEAVVVPLNAAKQQEGRVKGG